MKLLIFSDSHGSSYNMENVMSLHAATSDYIIHLGDGCDEFALLMKKYPDKPYYTVAGNLEDWNGYRAYERLIVTQIGSLRVMMCHGHRYDVKTGYDKIISAALSNNADAIFWGHTHLPYIGYIAPDEDSRPPLYLLCPGSIARPLSGRPSYGIAEQKNGILLSTPML